MLVELHPVLEALCVVPCELCIISARRDGEGYAQTHDVGGCGWWIASKPATPRHSDTQALVLRWHALKPLLAVSLFYFDNVVEECSYTLSHFTATPTTTL